MRKGFATLLFVVLLISACAKEAAPEALREELPPGRVWINTFGEGLTVLSSRGWATFYEDTMTFDLALDPQGRLWVAHFEGLACFDGRKFVALAESKSAVLDFDEQGRLWAGGIWAAPGYGVGLFDGEAWTTFAFDDYGIADVGTGSFRDIAVDDQGRVWVATFEALVVFDGQGWTTQPLPSRFSANVLAVDDRGRLWAGHIGGVSLLDGTSWTTWAGDEVGLEHLFDVEDIAFDDRGRTWMATSSKGLVVFDGETWERYDMSNSGLVNDRVRAVAIDGQGRVWAGTDCGVSVFDGKDWITYDQSNSGLFSNDVKQILIEAGGVASLPELQQVRVGELRGSVVREDKPVAGARVLLCTSVTGTVGLGFSGETPCKGPFQRETVTDEEGTFAFSDVPVGEYELTIQSPEGKWFTIMASKVPVAESFTVAEGKTASVGRVIIGE